MCVLIDAASKSTIERNSQLAKAPVVSFPVMSYGDWMAGGGTESDLIDFKLHLGSRDRVTRSPGEDPAHGQIQPGRRYVETSDDVIGFLLRSGREAVKIISQNSPPFICVCFFGAKTGVDSTPEILRDRYTPVAVLSH